MHTYTVTATDLAGNIGHSSNEAIVGSTNADTIVGNGGNDLIIGGGGADVITGGAGHVTFIYDAATDSTPAVHETITDFASSRDIINFTTIAGINATGGIATFQGMLSGLAAFRYTHTVLLTSRWAATRRFSSTQQAITRP